MEVTESRVRYALIVQYDGTAYSGFQIQNNAHSIQYELENALHILTREEVRIVAAGRTDAGVHALGQVVHFDLHKKIPADKLCISLNGILPGDIAVKHAYCVDTNFHARYSAIAREYNYLIYNHPYKSPFMRYRAMWVREHIDIEFCRQAASYLIGEKDFASFCKKTSADEGTVRFIEYINVERVIDDLIVFTIKGNAFLHNMVRIIVGTVLQLLHRGQSPETMQKIIESRDRNRSGPTAPAYGLYLKKVYYPQEYDFLNV
ncbi:MAG: tRNA pseudouridine(38-40) synthase TruA [Spirochaetes bacterium]|nr:tRNA pseudouridine(38-40) synthase TruA [Spirochaetota bacterium]